MVFAVGHAGAHEQECIHGKVWIHGELGQPMALAIALDLAHEHGVLTGDSGKIHHGWLVVGRFENTAQQTRNNLEFRTGARSHRFHRKVREVSIGTGKIKNKLDGLIHGTTSDNDQNGHLVGQ